MDTTTTYLPEAIYRELMDALYSPEIGFGQQTRMEHIAAALAEAGIMSEAHGEIEA